MARLKQPGCCECGENCLPKFLFVRLPRCGFPVLRVSGISGSYRQYSTKHFTYTTGSGQSYEVTITVHHRSGQVSWTETSNLDSTQRATMFSRITAGLNAVSFSGELTSASGSGGGDGGYNWDISVSGEFTAADDLTDLQALVDDAIDNALNAMPENYRAAYGLDTYGTAGLGGVTDVSTLTGRTAALSSTAALFGEYTAEGYYSTFGVWWQTDLTGAPDGVSGLFDTTLYSCDYEDRSTISAPIDATLGELWRHIIQISGPMCAKIWNYVSNASGAGSLTYVADVCYSNESGTAGIVISPQPSFVDVDEVQLYGAEIKLTSPGYLTAGDCPCSGAP